MCQEILFKGQPSGYVMLGINLFLKLPSYCIPIKLVTNVILVVVLLEFMLYLIIVIKNLVLGGRNVQIKTLKLL